MAVIAIFCDGTWNKLKGGGQTHVARLAKACDTSRTQKVLYVEGVGTGAGIADDVDRWLSKVGGGLFGWGLNRNIKAAYLVLCNTYQPGDKIMVFGFSRGAYTARSLVGLIRKCGILAEPTPQNMRRAFRLYRRRGARHAPDTEKVWAARRRLSPDFATSQEDVVRRADHSYLVRIAYLGVWDTVGALGIPQSIFGRIAVLWNARYAFHDTSLTRLVEHARHAVALDERRVLYEPSLWDNLDTSEEDLGLNRGDTSPQRPYQQVWFAGNHGIVGGSVAPKGLGTASLAWLWDGAAQAGLKLAAAHRIPETRVNAAADAPDLYQVGWLYRLLPWLVQWRRGPEAAHQLHNSVRLRATLVPAYRPRTLARALAGLFRPE